MKTLGPFRTAFLGMAMLLILALLPTFGYADGIDFSNVTSASVTEGNSTVLTITVTNNLGAPVTAEGVSSFVLSASQGDPSDDPGSFVSVDPNHTCGSPVSFILANGASCSIDFVVQTDSAVGEKDFDSGMDVMTVNWEYVAPGGGAPVFLSPNDITITVNDPAPVPEPASSMLFGSAIATVCVLFRRRLIPNRNVPVEPVTSECN
jgi:hypothetical protein